MATEQIDGIEFYVDVDTAGAVSSTKTIDNTTKKIEGSFKKLDTQVTKSSKSINKALAAQSRRFGQVSIQAQQFIGQVQGGQSFLVAFSQQIADIGIVAGLPLAGAFAGISASLVGIFLPSVLKSADATSELEKAIKAVSKVAKDNDGIKEFTEEIAKLAEQSEVSARLMVLAAEQSAKDAGKAAAKGIGEEFNKSFDVAFFQKSFDALKSIAGTAEGTGYSISQEYKELGERFGLTGKEAREAGEDVLVSLREMEIAVSSGLPNAGDKIIAFQEKLSELAKTSSGENRVKLLGFVSSISDYVKEAKKAAEVSKFLSDALAKSKIEAPTKKTKQLASATDDLIESLNAQFIALGQGEEAAFRYATAQQLGLKVGEQIPANIDAQISALFRLKQAQKDSAQQKRKSSSLTSSTANLGLTSEEQVRAGLARDLDLLNQAQDAKIESEKSYEERRVELRRQAEERIRAINKKSADESIVNFEALENQAIGTFASVAIGARDGKEAVADLARSVATQLIGALIKMGIQAVIGQTTAAATGAATAATLSAAYATPAALASLASFGANAAPAAAGIASTVGLAQGISLAGGREHGGPVAKNSLYEVGEKNKPEMLMIPGNNGKVFSNAEMKSAMSGGGGGGDLNVKVINLPGQTASVTQQGEGVSRETVIQIISEQSAQLGTDLNRNINKNHNVTNRQSANRRN